MKIALFSFELVGGGGIGTYVKNAANMLAFAGHRVEVFTDNQEAIGEWPYPVHGVACEQRQDFPQAVAPVFAARHNAGSFDVIEVPEYGAEGAKVKELYPDLPMLVRLHTPSFVTAEIWESYTKFGEKLRFVLGAARRGRWPVQPWGQPDRSGEAEVAQAADLVVGPSQSILDLVGDRWDIPHEARMMVPNVFTPPKALLALDPGRASKTVLYVGRLEVRKGVLDLADAVGRVCAADPDVRFVFLGRSLPFPHKSHDTKTEMLRRIGRWQSHVTFVDNVPYERVPEYFARAGIAVFPSVWESFGYVCLEAMAAGCGTIGSSAGGMAEIIEDGKSGLLVPPRDAGAIAKAVLNLLRDSDRRIAMGRAARERVKTAYGPETILPLQIASYEMVIERSKQRRRLLCTS